MRVQLAGVKSGRFGGHQAEVRSPTVLLVDHFLRIIEAAAALHFAAETGVSPIGRPRAFCRGVADLVLGDPVANTNDHEDGYKR